MQQRVTDTAPFQGRPRPDGTELAGWAALVHALDFRAPVSDASGFSHRHVGGSQSREGPWRIFDKRCHAGNDLAAQLAFALRHESIDLLILKRTLGAV